MTGPTMWAWQVGGLLDKGSQGVLDCGMSLADFRVLSFDCYGTMIDWEAGILSNIRPWTEAQGVHVGNVEILEAFARAESAEEAAAPDARYPTILQRVHARMATQWGLVADEAAAARFGDSVGSWPTFSDSHEALTKLQERYRLVILSNVDRASFTDSQKQLDVEFDAIYTAEDIGSYKPDPRNFAYLLESERSAGYRRVEILHVGQSLFHDHVPAINAGIATCWIQRPTPVGDHGAARPPANRPQVDFRFTSLAELAEAANL